jgi:hypothetical protein
MNFPFLVVDNFLEDPDSARQFGINEVKLERKNQSTGKSLRGLRSASLNSEKPELYHEIFSKICGLYPPLANGFVPIGHLSCEMEYQLTDGTWQGGWVHSDFNFLTCILYLTPGANINCGTSLFVGKYPEARSINDDLKKDGNENLQIRVSPKYKYAMEENNNQFTKTVQTGNIYNRIFIFPGDIYHSSDGFFGESKEDSRLTICSFFYINN